MATAPTKKMTKRVDHERVTVYLPRATNEALKIQAVKERRTYSAVIERYVVDGLKRDAGEK
jgi:hypothetical protein